MEKEPILESRKFHEVWVEQCEAAKEIKRRYGLRAAFDYLVVNKPSRLCKNSATGQTDGWPSQ